MTFDDEVEAEKARRRAEKLRQDMLELETEKAQLQKLSDYKGALQAYFGGTRLQFDVFENVAADIEHDGVHGIGVTDTETEEVLGYVFLDADNAHFKTGSLDGNLFMIPLTEFPDTLKAHLVAVVADNDMGLEGE